MSSMSWLDEPDDEADLGCCECCHRRRPSVLYNRTSQQHECEPCRDWGQDMLDTVVREAMEDL